MTIGNFIGCKTLFLSLVAFGLCFSAAPCAEDATCPSPESQAGATWYMDDREFPTPEGVESYRLMLEDRLLERYNNLPDYAGKVAKVSVVLSKPLDISLDAKFIKAEFDQLVYDSWGHRIPALEKEYYSITFGSGGVEQVRSEPSIRVGLDLEKTYSERSPLAADPFRNVEGAEAFRDTPKARMPEWWRPQYPEID